MGGVRSHHYSSFSAYTDSHVTNHRLQKRSVVQNTDDNISFTDFITINPFHPSDDFANCGHNFEKVIQRVHPCWKGLLLSLLLFLLVVVNKFGFSGAIEKRT